MNSTTKMKLAQNGEVFGNFVVKAMPAHGGEFLIVEFPLPLFKWKIKVKTYLFKSANEQADREANYVFKQF